MQILVVEDDDRFAAALSSALTRRGFAAVRAASARTALTAAASQPPPDLVLLDMGLPDFDGLEVCRQLRTWSAVPIIVITARGGERAQVAGLRAGADDYVIKPFGMEELVARIDAVLRRARGHVLTDVVRVGNVDVGARAVRVDGRSVALTRKEFDLLALLARVPGTTVDRATILAEVWQTTWSGGGKTLDVHVATLRAKLGRPNVVETVRGVGYRLVTEGKA